MAELVRLMEERKAKYGPAASLENRQGGHPKRAHLPTLMAPGRKGTIGPQ